MQIHPLSFAERLDWLRLIRTETIGPVAFFQLLKLYGTPQAALAALPDWAKRGKRSKPLKVMSVLQAKNELQAHTDINAQLVAFCESDYPPLLRTIEDPPPVLSILGHPSILDQKSTIAIVGTRNATLNGRRFAKQLAEELGMLNYTVVSGMARGIDCAAHQGSLTYGTAAVLAGGIDFVYPPEHQSLYEEIQQTGLIVSEQPLGLKPMACHFPRRNRLISGISQGVIVIEATNKSGSLITARHGLEQGREIFAVPGSPLESRSWGCNKLIQQGATLIQSAMDVDTAFSFIHHLPCSEFSITSEIIPATQLDRSFDSPEIEDVRRYLNQSLSIEPVSVDELIRDRDFPVPFILAVLLEMEIAGRLTRFPGNRVSLHQS